MFASFPPFAGLVTFAERLDPIPSRTRPSNAFAPMVLCLKTWESRPLPGLRRAGSCSFGAGWSSPVARQAHNLKVTGSNPVPATKQRRQVNDLAAFQFGFHCRNYLRQHCVNKSD